MDNPLLNTLFSVVKHPLSETQVTDSLPEFSVCAKFSSQRDTVSLLTMKYRFLLKPNMFLTLPCFQETQRQSSILDGNSCSVSELFSHVLFLRPNCISLPRNFK